jgi:hypothetical protein
MKRKVEKYIFSKNFFGTNRIKSDDGRYLIGDDVEGCLAAARQGSASKLMMKGSKGGVGANNKSQLTAKPPNKPSLHKRKLQAFSAFPGGPPSTFTSSLKPNPPKKPKTTDIKAVKKLTVHPASVPMRDRQEMLEFCRSLKGGYVDGVYRSAIERRRIAEAVCSTGPSLIDSLNELNLTPEERSRLPLFFQVTVMPHLAAYKSASPHGKNLAARFGPSPISLETVSFNPFPSSHYNHCVATPIGSDTPMSGVQPLPSFSPFISPHFMSTVAADEGMAITPGVFGSAQQPPPGATMLNEFIFGETPCRKSTMLNEFIFGETPCRKLDAFLDGTGTVPPLPTTEEFARHKAKLPDYAITDAVDTAVQSLDDEAAVLHATFSFSDMLSPEEDAERLNRSIVTDSGPLRMRLKNASGVDLSTHHFDTWESP